MSAVPDNYDKLQRRRAEYKEAAPGAAVKVQAEVRRAQAKARTARMKREQLEQSAAELQAAVVIQARERGNAERRQLEQQKLVSSQSKSAVLIQSKWRSVAVRRSLVALQATLRAASFKRRKQVLENDHEDERRRRAELEVRLSVLEEEATKEKIAAAEHHRRSQLNKVKREDERNKKKIAFETEKQREALRARVASTVGAREARLAEESEMKEQHAKIAERFMAQEEAAQRRELDKRLKASLVVDVEHEAAAHEEYAIANQRREDRESLAYLCAELCGSMDVLTGAGVGEMFRALDPESYRPEELPKILTKMGAKVMAPGKGGTPQRRRRPTAEDLEGLARQSTDGSNLVVTLDRLYKWWDRGGSREIGELLGVPTGDRLSALAVLEYVRKFRANERVQLASTHCQRLWRGKRARLTTGPKLEQRRSELRAQLEAAEQEAAAQREKEEREELQKRQSAALTLQTSMRVFLAKRKVKRVRQKLLLSRKQAQRKSESKRQAQRRLVGRSDYEKRVDASSVREVPRRTSAADVFNIDEQGQAVESIWPKNWLRCLDEQTKRLYWYNHRSHESRWDAPPELAGLKPKSKHTRVAHEDDSWTARQNYKARTASVTAGMYGSRQPRFARARIIRQLRRTARPQSSLPARRTGSADARKLGSEAGVVDRRSAATSARPQQDNYGNQLSERSHRPASARPARETRSQRPQSPFSMRPASAGRVGRPQSAPDPTSVQSAENPHAIRRRAHINQLCQPKAIQNVLRLGGAEQFVARPPSMPRLKVIEPSMPAAAFTQHRNSTGPRQRPQSASAVVARRSVSRHRPRSATTGRGAGQGPLGRSVCKSSLVVPSSSGCVIHCTNITNLLHLRVFHFCEAPSAPAPAVKAAATHTGGTSVTAMEESSLRLEQRASEAAACEDYALAERLQARANAIRLHPGQSPQAR